jgi:rubredoxin
MPVTCPNGHQSESTDYCDTCGAVIAILPPLPTADPAAGTAVMPSMPVPPDATCPNCGAPRAPDEIFCEVCGLNFSSGQLPSPAAERAAADPEAVSAEWVAVVSADHRYFESNQAENPDDTVTYPTDAEVREVPLTSNEILIGRRSDSKGIFPAIDLSDPPSDPGVSRRHALLRLKLDGWVVIDQGSTNGTLVRGAVTPIKPGDAVRLHDGDHLNVGAWTRITLRRVGAPA